MKSSFLKSAITVCCLLSTMSWGCAGPGHHALGEQLKASDQGSVFSMQGYMASSEADQENLKKRWHLVANAMRTQPGFIWAKLSRGVGGSSMWVAHSEWSSLDALREAFSKPEVLEPELNMPSKSFEHLFILGAGGDAAAQAPPTPNTESEVVLINPFTVEPQNVEGFLKGWGVAADYLKKQRGFISTKLHRSLNPDSTFQFINIAIWESPQAFKAAVSTPTFRQIAENLPAKGDPGLYQSETK